MKERDKRKNHISSRSLLTMLDTLLLKPSLHFTQLHLTPLHYICDISLPLISTSPNYTSLPSHLA